MFKCRVCMEKDKRIDDLNAQIKDLRTLVYRPLDPSHTTLVAQEADQVLSGSTDVTEIQADRSDEQQRLDSEAIALLTGSYDQSYI